MRFLVMCKVYLGYRGTRAIEHGFCACTVDNYLSVQAHNHALSHKLNIVVSGLTLEWSGLSGNRSAARMNPSGAGFPRFTSGSEPDITKWSKSSKNSLCFTHLSLKLLSLDPVTTARGTLCLYRCLTSLSAPGRIHTTFKDIEKKNEYIHFGSSLTNFILTCLLIHAHF